MTIQLRRAAASVAVATLAGLSVLGGPVRAGVPTGEETPLERVNALVQPSIVYLQQDWSAYVFDKANKTYLNGGQLFQLSFQCTGFVVNPDGYIATAGHCVDLDEVKPSFYATAAQWAVDNGYYVDPTLTVDQIVGFQDYRVETFDKVNRADLVIQVGWGAAASGIQTAEVRRARVIDSTGTDAGDVALLKVEADGLNALPLSDQEVEVGTEIVSVGYPASVDTVTDPDLTPSFKDGAISSVKTIQGGMLTVYEVSAAVSGGMSGGPTVDLDGRVVGVNSFGIAGETQPFNFVRPASQVAELLAGAGVANELGETTTAYRDGLQAYWDGDRAEAVELLGGVVEAQPSNQLAVDYLDRAEDLPKPAVQEESSSSTLAAAIIVGATAVAVLVAGAVIGLVLVRRRRATQPPAPPAGRAPVALAPPAAPAPAAAPAPVPSSQPAPMVAAAGARGAGPGHHFCGHCGEAVEHDAEFCTNCGRPLT